jgi:hypothetical protein
MGNWGIYFFGIYGEWMVRGEEEGGVKPPLRRQKDRGWRGLYAAVFEDWDLASTVGAAAVGTASTAVRASTTAAMRASTAAGTVRRGLSPWG